jgi:opacity protein-like surface antigen
MRYKRFLLMLSILCSAAGGVAAAPADEVRALLEQGQVTQAYDLALKHPDQLGQPAFDFYFGVAAIGAGHAGEGVLALERFVVNAPQNINGRLELARGYFVLGEDARARAEFEIVLAANPPPEVQANVQRFLDAIRAREYLYRQTSRFYVEGGIGYDTNVNGGVGNDSISRWGLVFQLPGAARRQSDDFLTIGAGFNWSRPLRPGTYLFAAGAVDGRYHDEQTTLDQQTFRGEAGLTFIRDKDLWRVAAGASTLQLEGNRFRDVLSLTGEWNRQLNELRSVNVFAQYADLDYAGANAQRDSTFITAGVGLRQAFVSPMQPLLSASLFAGREDVQSSVRSDLSRDVYGARASLSVTPRPKWSVVGGLTLQTSRYDGGAPSPVPGLPPEPTRKDDYYALDVGVTYAFDRQWSVRAEWIHSRNGSNDSLSGFKRDVVGVKARYEFR